MNLAARRKGGFALITGAAFLIVTMMLHPQSGDLQHIKEIRNINMVAHALAILSVPILMFGLTFIHDYLNKSSISLLAFILQGFSFVAVIIAAAINGLALPLFIDQIPQDPEHQSEPWYLILKYGWSLNQAFDLIYTAGTSLALALWSFAILKTHHHLRYFGFAGVVLAFAILASMMGGFNYTNLHGLRIFVALWVLWILVIGIRMMSSTHHPNDFGK